MAEDASAKRRVADYFAILGVGDTLVWKHTQKKEDDEAALLERFYREIVQVSIVTPHHHNHLDHSQNIHPSMSDASTTFSTETPQLSDGGGFILLSQTCPSPSSAIGIGGAGQLDANLDLISGLRAELSLLWPSSKDDVDMKQQTQQQHLQQQRDTPLKGFKNKLRKALHKGGPKPRTGPFYVGYRKRAPDETDQLAIANITLRYVKIHRHSTTTFEDDDDEAATTLSTTSSATQATIKLATALKARVGSKYQNHGNNKFIKPFLTTFQSQEIHYLPLQELLPIPDGFQEWVIPEEYQWLKFTSSGEQRRQRMLRKTVLFSGDDAQTQSSSGERSGAGVEAYVEDASSSYTSVDGRKLQSWEEEETLEALDIPFPRLLPETLPRNLVDDDDDEYMYVPVLAIRRQRVGEEERFHEDPGIVDMAMTFCDANGHVVLPDPCSDMDDEEEEDDDSAFRLVGKTKWSSSSQAESPGTPAIAVKRNVPIGFADAAFATKVLDRFPVKNYKGLPLPEEELPMFCYPTGCRLHRARYSDAPLPHSYGFVVKNERGDSIHVSCVSFMEPLTTEKIEQLSMMSERRRRTSLPNRRYCERRERLKPKKHRQYSENGSIVSDLHSYDEAGDSRRNPIDAEVSDIVDGALSDRSEDEGLILTAFDDMTTFENKTICLISRYPFWTAFRRFLSHLHIMSGSSSDLPLERCISHLVLGVPVPKPGGPCVVVPLPALNGPMMLCMPPSKDFPLVDLPFQRLLACLDVPTIVTVVLGFLALERKIIIMSSRPSLVLDGCELLRSLLFPFDLCAPYVPRLTQPFISCLDFPGAIFVGIHDDGSPDGLASIVRKDLPEDSAIVDLDTGEIHCSGDRYHVLKQCWGIIPSGPRSMLVSEVETLCRDAGIVPGQEPLDSQVDAAFDAPIPAALVEDFNDRGHDTREPLDDRAVRDAFLRFFCSVLGGYERYLVVPDVDFLVSGNEWFDTKNFLTAAPPDRAPYLGALVTTQLFQSFIQRRTEASDVHCLLFDECLIEYHSSPIPYGRLGGDVETVANSDEGQPQMLYSLLVDQCSSEPYQSHSFDLDTKASDRSTEDASDFDMDMVAGHKIIMSVESMGSVIAKNGDIVTAPSRHSLSNDARFVYCVDGNPCFPHKLNASLYSPSEPQSLLIEISETPPPLLARSEKEVEEANRRRKIATSYRGLSNQRRCLWQLPKLMGSHFLGTWLMCIPAQVSQPNLTQEQQSRYLLRALGAMRLLRNKQRIIPDEAAYRALMVACGRTDSDRRIELVKLFGLLRSDGIFPSAVTLGQYTRALAEGYSKRSVGMPEDDFGSVEVTVSASRDGNVGNSPRPTRDVEIILSALDGNLAILEDSGRRWRQRQRKAADSGENMIDLLSSSTHHGDVKGDRNDKKSISKSFWMPVVTSSSFVPGNQPSYQTEKGCLPGKGIQLVALWSRTLACKNCGYVPLDEEVQSGWDVICGDDDTSSAVSCPRCGAPFLPMLGYQELSMDEALTLVPSVRDDESQERNESKTLPPQIRPEVDNSGTSNFSANVGYVHYFSPAALRAGLERYMEEGGEAVLARDTLRRRDPALFYNLWWYCARFSLPLPLPTTVGGGDNSSNQKQVHTCAFAAWDRTIALRGCYAGAKAMHPFCSEFGDNCGDSNQLSEAERHESSVSDFPLLSRFGMQSLCQGDWDHEDLSEILVKLVEACDKLDFKPVVECVLRCNARKREFLGLAAGLSRNNDTFEAEEEDDVDTAILELDCYRTILYLAKYQCTTAFHVFFPATAKPCKGYHFWCAIGTPLPLFDHMFRDAIRKLRLRDNKFTPINDVSDVALGFRCVFGHIL